MSKAVWQIMVPTTKHRFKPNAYGEVDWDGPCKPCRLVEHQAFDAYVMKLTGGMTIGAGGTKGKWVCPEGREYNEGVIPVLVICDRDTFREICEWMVVHYRQKEVLGFKLSDEFWFFKHSEYDGTQADTSTDAKD